jgi:ATP-dependent RNA helicase RhlE
VSHIDPPRASARRDRIDPTRAFGRPLRGLPKVIQLTTFTELNLHADLLKALETEGYTNPTPIQQQAIPYVMSGRDLLGIAQTGTGKTAAFALPILHRLAADKKLPLRKGCRCLVLSPTRELASQIAESFRVYGKNMGIKVAIVFGGVAHRPQIQALANGVDVLVATPGRLIDHMMERNVDLQGTEIFVLDEADQMLDLGFVIPIRKIVQKLSQRRQNLFFSATMPKEIGRLADELLIDPAKVSVAPVATTAERVSQSVIHIESGKKRALLAELMADVAMSRTLVFTRTKRGADRVAKYLEVAGVKCSAIHGNKSQRQREEALGLFKVGKIRALIATDIAARGIDIDLVTHVVNFELPNVPESYVHRIGRTARAGAEGIAISFCASDERPLLKDIERLTRQVIPSSDRRNDAALIMDAPGKDRGERYEDPRSNFSRGGRGAAGGREGGREGGRGASANTGYRARPEGARTEGRGADLLRTEGGSRFGGDRRDATGQRRDDRVAAPRFDNNPAEAVIPRRGYDPMAERPQELGQEFQRESRGLNPDRPAERPARSDRNDRPAYRGDRPAGARASGDRPASRGRSADSIGGVAFLSREGGSRDGARPPRADAGRSNDRPSHAAPRSQERRDGGRPSANTGAGERTDGHRKGPGGHRMDGQQRRERFDGDRSGGRKTV